MSDISTDQLIEKLHDLNDLFSGTKMEGDFQIFIDRLQSQQEEKDRYFKAMIYAQEKLAIATEALKEVRHETIHGEGDENSLYDIQDKCNQALFKIEGGE